MDNSQFQLKNLNRRLVLNYIRKNRLATKAGLAAVTGLTFMAIQKIIAELESLELVRKDLPQTGGVGRNAITYRVNEKYGYSVGIHINSFRTTVALLDLNGSIVQRVYLELEHLPPSQERFVADLVDAVEHVVEASAIDRSKVLGVGIGVPGPVDSKEGLVLMPPNLKLLHYLPLKRILEQQLQLPVCVQKDTNAIALGEYWHGLGSRYDNLVYLDLDAGIGGGLVIDGKLHEGSEGGVAGEFGHMIMDVEGPLCNCGNRGCLEAIGSGLAILRAFSQELAGHPEHKLYLKRNSLGLQDVLEAAAASDLLVLHLLNKSAFYTGIAVRNLINLFNPQIIILGGILIKGYPRFFEIVKDVADSRKMKGSREQVILVSEPSDEMGIVGAGEIVADHFFEDVALRQR